MKLIRLSLLALAVGFFVLLGSRTVRALAVPPTPTDIPIVDQTGTLTTDQIATLATKIAAERSATGNQIGVLVIPSLQGAVLEDYSLDVARKWGIGTTDRNSGVLLLVVKDDRKLRIEVGYGLEGALTDIRSNQIIRDRIRPEFQQNHYYEGIGAGIDGIAAAIQGEVDPNLRVGPAGQNTPGIPWEAILIGGFVGFSWLGSILARSKSWWAGGVIGGVAGGAMGVVLSSLLIGILGVVGLSLIGLVLDRAVSRNYHARLDRGVTPSWWAGGGFGGGSGGGGFGGFGGGFGGGGASGDW